MANKPSYFSNLIDRFDIINIPKYLLNSCYFSVVVLIVLTQSSVLANTPDSDGDGLSDSYEISIGLESYLSDTDGDEVKDGDEIGNNKNSPLDSDNDGVIDALDYDDDNDGLPTYLESKKDSDKDGLLDFLDTDSDNDGIADGIEAGILNQDKNQDGVDDAFDIMRKGAVDNNGDGIDDNVKLPDHNNDGKPDYLDSSFQHQKLILVQNGKSNDSKSMPKVPSIKVSKKIKNKTEVVKIIVESTSEKLANTKNNDKNLASVIKPKSVEVDQPVNMVINRHTDSDNDGLSNSLEKSLGTNHLNRDSDGDKVSDAIEIGMDINSPQDSDRDGIIDALDNDDDNDGILTKFEDLNNDSTAINDDTDNDGVPNYLDANDDGDSLLTKAEGSIADTDGDGILDYLDKNDGLKDISNKVVKTNDQKIDSEPEIVVLFDGDAALLTDEDSDDEYNPVQDEILSSLDGLLKDQSLDEDNKDQIIEESRPTQTSSKKIPSHWNLF